MVIAIDGPAGSGKSTLAKFLAKRLGFIYINSGSLYRAITLACIREGISLKDGDTAAEAAALKCAKRIKLDYRKDSNPTSPALFLDCGSGPEDVSELLHSDAVDAQVAALSAIVPVRHLVNGIIRKMAGNLDSVVEGRDMTTEVFPGAAYRFYLDASPESRAKRRFEQGVSNLGFEEIKKTIEARDELDKHKAEGSLVIGRGVIYIDNSILTIEQSYDKILSSITGKGQSMGKSLVKSSGKDNSQGAENQTQMQEEFLKSLEQLEEGQLVSGKVIEITSDHVFIDVGYKSEGKISLSEFDEPPSIGEEVSVLLVSKENKHGEVIVSKQKADEAMTKRALKTAFTDKTPIQGKIAKVVKGGYEVDLGGGTTAFMPISQADIHRIEKPESLLGTKVSAFIERLYSDGKLNVVVNARKVKEVEIEAKREEFFKTAEIGMEIDGVVKSFTSFGAFVDIGGFDGLLHINDMSWGHVVRPKDFVRKGQNIRVKVLRLDTDDKRINLSLKHFSDDPWVHFEDKYHVNDIVKGKVTKIADFGAFIELEEGIEGLAHISEFSWVKKVQKPEDVFKPDDIVECMILGYDLGAGRVSLGIKQVTANPWSEIESKYPTGTRLKRKVVKVTGSGAFIELEEGIDGFLHGDDFYWTKKVKHIGSEIKVDDEIEVMVIKVDVKNRNVKLGVKQLSEDPWKSFAATYKVGSIVEGEVSSVTDFGVFVKVPGEIEGLIHKSNLVKTKEENPDEVLKTYKVGDPIKAVIWELQPDKQKLAFSLRDYERKMEREEISRYMSSSEESDGSTFTLGDALKSKSGEDSNPSE